MGIVTIGLKEIGFAPLAVDGGPGTVFTKKFNTSTDSFSFTQEDGSEKTVDVEESEDPLFIRKTKGRKAMTCSIADMDTELLAELEGGTITEDVENNIKRYAEPETPITVERTVRIVPENGLTKIINRALLSITESGSLGKNNEKLYTLTIDALKPEKAGVPVSYTEEELA